MKRLGGGFGAKIDQCNLVSTATALAAQKFRRPVRVALDLETNMTMVGWRDPFYFTYKVIEALIMQAMDNTFGNSFIQIYDSLVSDRRKLAADSIDGCNATVFCSLSLSEKVELLNIVTICIHCYYGNLFV